MENIASDLLKALKADFQNNFNQSKRIQELYDKIRDGTATYAEANDFAVEVGSILADAFSRRISSEVLPDGKMYDKIARQMIEPMLINNYDLISDMSCQVQNVLNQSAKIGIKAIKPELNQSRIDGIVNKVSDADDFDKVSWVLNEPVKNFSQSIVDDTIKVNAEFHGKSGMQPRIVRKVAGNCCDWCKNLAGSYLYPDVPQEVYQRHQYCRCTVEYDPGDGRRQNVHSKIWKTDSDRAKIETRKRIGKVKNNESPEQRENRVKEENGLSLAAQIAKHPMMLGAYTPAGLKKSLERSGCTVRPLQKGKYKGILFEDGGGYKVNFGGDGLLQYHPEKGSHHGGAYYKIATGNQGLKWYNMKGEEIDVGKTAELGRQITK